MLKSSPGTKSVPRRQGSCDSELLESRLCPFVSCWVFLEGLDWQVQSF